MKIVEALKAQKKIADKVNRNNEKIELYCSKLSSEKPYFDSDTIQRQEVDQLIQSNVDLVKYYIWLRRCIDYTNTITKVEINGKQYTISELMNLKRLGIKLILSTYNSLNDSQTNRRLLSLGKVTDAKAVTIERFYDEKIKNDALAEWRDLYDSIDSKLEIVNAVTDLNEVEPNPTEPTLVKV